eukprot:TRINITY_DN27491_c0_g2_i1.p1 TRINITY_DN27491_c0_g2~~TRINITY_DN27491_c0_g2_i1.p1  ORF type:complete len:863 (-),score=154.54 TRINITY_DN27491_c0_g2_i1:326-2914(-)
MALALQGGSGYQSTTLAVSSECKADEDGFHHVNAGDGINIRFRLLCGGPRGDHSFEPKLRTAICLHGVGDSLGWWEDAVFRTKELPEGYTPSGGLAAAMGSAGTPGFQALAKVDGRRKKFVEALAKRVNVVLLDLRGFGGSGRPRSEAPWTCDNITSLQTWKVQDITGFTKAIKTALATSKVAGAASHSVSLAGSTALVRVSFRTMQALGIYFTKMSELPKPDLVDSYACLQTQEFTGCAAKLAELKMIPESLMAGQPNCSVSCEASFENDSEGMGAAVERVLVIHRLKLLPDAGHKLAEVSNSLLRDVKHNDASCISLNISSNEKGAVAICITQGAQGALAHLQRFQQWLEGEAGSLLALQATQLHARGAELKSLREVVAISFAAQFFQLFPLSYEDSQGTEARVSLSNFVEDVESVRCYIGAAQVSIIGHSMGSAIGLEYAVRYPQRVDRVCLSAGAPRVGQAAYANWMSIAGETRAWTESVIRGAVALVSFDDKELHKLDVPTLLINAKDDTLTPVIGSQMLEAALPIALLHIPDFGGHDCLVSNSTALERLVRFLAAEEAMLFAEDPLFGEQLVNRWNLPGDKAFMRYYNSGKALAQVEAVERRLRLLRHWARNSEFQDGLQLSMGLLPKLQDAVATPETKEAINRRQERVARLDSEQAAMRSILKQARLPIASGSTPREQLMAEMMEMLSRMSVPAREVVERAGVWWRDSGAPQGGGAGDGSKYTVDAWRRRRGGSKSGCCSWYRWDLNSVPLSMRTGLISHGPPPNSANDSMFACWWCGGPASAHEDVGPAGEKEELSFFPGLGPGRQPWSQAALADFAIDKSPEEQEDTLSGQVPRYSRINLAETSALQLVPAIQ